MSPSEQGMMYIESSAKTAKNVKEIMQNVASRLPEGAGVREEDAQAKRAADRRAGGRGGAVSVDDSSQAAGKAGGCC